MGEEKLKERERDKERGVRKREWHDDGKGKDQSIESYRGRRKMQKKEEKNREKGGRVTN